MPNYLDPLTAAQLQANQEQAGLANYGAGFIPKFIAPIDLDPNISIGFTLPFGTTQTGPSFNASMTTIEAIDVDRYDGGVDQSANINVTVTFSINDGAESSAVGIPLTLADFQGGSGGTAQENFDLAANSLSAGGGGY